jgi:hypothetical protein
MYKYLFCPRLNQPDLLFRQAVQLVDQPVDLPVRGFDAVAIRVFSGVRAGGGELPVQVELDRHQLHQPIVADDISGVGEADG